MEVNVKIHDIYVYVCMYVCTVCMLGTSTR